MSRLVALSLLALSGCGSKTAPTPVAEAPNPFAALEADMRATLNTEVSPCDDFYEYACGGWLASSAIPGDESRWSRGFSVVYERNEANIKKLIEEAAAAAEPTALEASVGAYFKACMDTDTLESRGGSPLAEVYASIEGIEDLSGIFRVTGEVQAHSTTPFFGLWIGQDFKDPNKVLLQFSQGGLGLPEKNFYVGERAKPEVLEAYVKHMAAMLTLSGMEAAEAEKVAPEILKLETSLAELAKERHELRDATKIYHPKDRAGLEEMSDKLDWKSFLEGLGYPDFNDFNVNTPEFFPGLATLLTETELGTLKAYLRWHVTHGMANRMSQDFVDENFAFYGTTLRGTAEQPERWKRCVRATGSSLGEEVGQLFIAEHFAGESKDVAMEMIMGIEAAFEEALPELEWMDETTRARAVEKARAIKNKIGYPDKWRDTSEVAMDAGKYFENTLALSQFDLKQSLDKVGNAPDPDEWHMSPQTVNAYYNPTQNEIAFPAGILQDPFFSASNPRAMNFGAMGTIMGHEISHGFDDSGRKFSATGTLEEWWEAEVSERFDERAECIVSQYGGYEPLPGKPLNGELTLGENIADNGGMKQSYRAYKKWIAANGAEPEVAGFSNEQLFFVGAAQSWCSLITPELQEQYLVTDPHSPAKFRVNGSVVNFPAFAEAFECPVGTPMNPENRCEVW
jgi:putative endopeptidase